MNSLTFSIIIPVFNEEDHLENCLESIAAQSVLPNEVIVVDNNCTDNSMQIAASYPFVRIVKEQKPGIFHARNAGFNAANSDIIGRIDADTILPETWVETAIDHISKNPDELITGGSYLYDMPWPKFAGWIQENFAFRWNKFIIGDYIAWGSNMAFSRKIWRDIKDELHDDPGIHEDMDLGFHLTDHGYKIRYDSSRKVGIDSRILTPRRKSRQAQLEYMKMWPRTLKKHNMSRAWLGDVGAFSLYYLYFPLKLLYGIARLSNYILKLKNEYN